jgi:N-methylhydantoinase A
LNPDHLVGGAVRRDAAKARSVIEERIARPLGTNTEEAAWGANLRA